MRRDILELREFYATRLGSVARTMVSRKLVEAWGDASGLDVLGLGYPTPYLERFRARARRVAAAMPSAQGVEIWPAAGRTLACLADEAALPFPNALFDRILVIHTLEEADDPLAVLRDVWRVLAPSGRVIVVVANRRGFWSNAESTPFGHGRPFTRAQLEALSARPSWSRPPGRAPCSVRRCSGRPAGRTEWRRLGRGSGRAFRD
jgi:SAM-dependent methyltransferase